MAIKVFHTGDLHLGMLYKSRGYAEGVREELVRARFETLARMIQKANEQECQLFVVAGDLFERLNVRKEQVREAARMLSGFHGLCVVLPGNHDYYTPDSPLWGSFLKEAGDNILLLSEPRPYSLKDYNLEAVLYPAPCQAKHSAVGVIDWIKDPGEKPEARWHLGLAHGSVRGYSPDFDDNYYPMEEEALRAAGLHFWFLGHTHVSIPAGDRFTDGTAFAYCGTPEPDGFDCGHRGAAWIIRLDRDGVEGEAVTTGRYRFLDMEETVHDAGDLERLVRELSVDGTHTLLRLKLRGILPRDDFENRHRWRGELEKGLFYLKWDDAALQMEITRDTIGDLYPRGSFPYRLLENLAERGEQQALQLAYTLMKGAGK